MHGDKSALKTLDLSNNNLKDKGSLEITKLIEDKDSTIETLILRKNGIGTEGLHHISSALTENTSIQIIDIRDNPIPDSFLKIFFGTLQKNDTILRIDYTVKESENITKREKIEKLQKEHKDDFDELESELVNLMGHHVDNFKWYIKACLPIWCWKSFIHDKHEAFRFRYNTKALNMLEKEHVSKYINILILTSLAYYPMVYITPFFLVRECGSGMQPAVHFIYLFYALMTAALEIWIVKDI